jgi:hypothetical protein
MKVINWFFQRFKNYCYVSKLVFFFFFKIKIVDLKNCLDDRPKLVLNTNTSWNVTIFCCLLKKLWSKSKNGIFKIIFILKNIKILNQLPCKCEWCKKKFLKLFGLYIILTIKIIAKNMIFWNFMLVYGEKTHIFNHAMWLMKWRWQCLQPQKGMI